MLDTAKSLSLVSYTLFTSQPPAEAVEPEHTSPDLSATGLMTSDTEHKTPPTGVFGSSSTQGDGATGFAGLAAKARTREETPEPAPAKGGDGDDAAEAEEECSADFKPVVQLEKVAEVSGEEGETVTAEFKCKLYRYDHGNEQWKERGVGQLRLLQSSENQIIRLLVRAEKTLKIRANHIVMPGTVLREHSGSEKTWVYSTVDFADETQKTELFCVRFANAERAQEFKEKFEAAMAHNDKLLGEDGKEAAGGAEGAAAAAQEDGVAAAADEIGALKVGGEDGGQAGAAKPGPGTPPAAAAAATHGAAAKAAAGDTAA